MKKRTLFAPCLNCMGLAVSLIIGFAAGVVSISPAQAERVVLQLRWDHQFQFAGYYAALWQGFYTEAGLDVEIRPAFDDNGRFLNVTKEVAAGRAHFGTGAMDVLTARDRGAPLSIVSTVFQQSPIAFYTKSDSGYGSLKDFTRLRVAVADPQGLAAVELKAMLKAEGIPAEQVTLLRAKNLPALEDLANGEADIVAGYTISAAWHAKRLGLDLLTISPSAYGVAFYGSALFTREEVALGNSDLVERFVSASLKGWMHAIKNPGDVASRIAEQLTRSLPVDDPLDLNLHQIKPVIDLTHFPLVHLGHTHPGRWKAMHEALRRAGTVKGSLDLDRFIKTPDRLQKAEEDRIFQYSVALLSLVAVVGVAGWLWSWRRRQGERQRARADLEETVSQLATAQRIGHMGYWRLYPETKTFEFSQELVELLSIGHLQNPVPFSDLLPLVYPADREGAVDYIARASGPEQPIHYEFRIQSGLGEKRYIAGESHLEDRSDNREATVFGVFQDVTDRKLSEVALRESEQKFRRLLDDALHGVVIHRYGKIVYVNRALAEMLDYPVPQDILALESVSGIVAAEDRIRLRLLAEQRQQGKILKEHYDARFVGRTGRVIQVQIMARLIDWDGEPAVQASVVDVTQRLEAEEIKRQAQKMEAIGQLTGGVAHDFNNLLAVIIGNLDMVSDDLAELETDNADNIRLLIQRALASADKGAGLTGQLLAFARKQSLSPDVTSVSTMLPDLRDMLDRTLPDSISLKLQVSETVSDFRVDTNQLTNALINLSVNARDAMPSGGTLTIRAEDVTSADIANLAPDEIKAPRMVVISVSDSGVGMDADTVAQAFEPFYTTKEVGAGTGLGLSMVFGFAKQSGGFAVIDSAPGEGATISIYLPVASEVSPDPGEAIVTGATHAT
jgi:PAS domain S-box-containing protein